MEQDQCTQCTYRNQVDAIQCLICGFVFEDKLKTIDIKSKIRKEIPLVKCQVCELENDIQNQYCLNCGHQLFQHIKKQCQICGFSVTQNNYERHYLECLQTKSLIEEEEKQSLQLQPLKIESSMIEPPQIKPPIIEPFKKLVISEEKMPIKIFHQQKENPFLSVARKYVPIVGIKDNGKNKTYCYYCYKHFDSSFQEHEKNCIKKKEWIQSISSQESRMTPLQIKTIMYMQNKCEKEHLALKKQLQAKVKKLGYSIEDLQNLQFYIQNYAPIIIQIHVSKHMQFFLKDTHYRSQFETNKSSGSLSRSSRTTWEDRMFDKNYSKATDFQRVKYGVINFTNDPKGVKCAASYGRSYFLLKSHIRDRCTFTDKDSSVSDSSISTLKYSFKVVNKMNDQQLKAAFKASKALEQSSIVLITYKQLQIHGPIQFSKDIERIYVSKQQIKGNKVLLDMVYEFSHQFKVQHDFI